MSEEYNLQALLELREQQQQNAEDEYATEIQELRRREEFVTKKKRELAEAVAGREQACREHDERLSAGGLSLIEINAFDGYLAGMRQDEAALKESIERARRSCEQQKRAVAQAKQELIEATKELKAVQKHREQWQEEQTTREQRRRSAAMDEVASRRWMEENR